MRRVWQEGETIMTNIFEILAKNWVNKIVSETTLEQLKVEAKKDLVESKQSLDTYSNIDWDKDDGLDF